MGWWNAPDHQGIVVGDAVLDSIRHFLRDFSREYQNDLSRKPTYQELEYALNLALGVNADDEIFSGFDELEIKNVILKTAKRTKRQKAKPGDIFAFKLDNERFGFGRIVSMVSIGSIAEIFDYFSTQPIFDYSRLGKWLIPPIPIDNFLLIEKKMEGDWRIIGHTADFLPGPEFDSLRYVYGTMPNMMKAVNIFGQIQEIDAATAEKLPKYSPISRFSSKKANRELFTEIV